jgi:integrase
MSDIAPATQNSIETLPSLSDDARTYARASKATNTLRAYAAQLKLWEAFCTGAEIQSYPADPTAVANWIAGRARSGQAYSTLRTAIAAVRAGCVAKGGSFDTRAPQIETVMKGIARVEAKAQQQAEPIRGSDVSALLANLGLSPIDLRDGALLALGYIFATRRSEIVSLDLDQSGTGSGFVRITAKTVEMTLAWSKTAKAGEVERVVVPRESVGAAVAAIERWIRRGGIQPGQPILRRVSKGGTVGGRLHPQSVARIIKRRIAEHHEKLGVPTSTARAEAARYSGHSLRVGFAVTAAEAGASADDIATVTRHRSPAMPSRYTKRADALKRSPFRRAGVGLGE